MRRSRTIPLVLGGLAAALAVGTSAVSLATSADAATSAGSSNDRHWRTTLKFVEHETGASQADLPPAGPSVGDNFFGTNPLFNESDTRQVGRQVGFCTQASKTTPAVLYCDLTYQLANGMITVHGIYDVAAGKVVSAVTGGTGAYVNARGEAISVFGPVKSTHSITLVF
ncbi:MAG: hypothetical protein DLM58_04950 [Pseudonocardiales bacterium]|nr:MAG: hypothetical protein DLM58_04950 [Pseudonocardiales bacterium]